MFKLMFHLLCTWVIICSLLSGCSKISKEIIEPVKQIKQQEEQASKPHPTNTQTIDYLNTWSSPFAHNLTTIMFAKESNYFQKKGEEKNTYKITTKREITFQYMIRAKNEEDAMIRTLGFVSKDGSGQREDVKRPMYSGKPFIREWIDKIEKVG